MSDQQTLLTEAGFIRSLRHISCTQRNPFAVLLCYRIVNQRKRGGNVFYATNPLPHVHLNDFRVSIY